MTDPPLNIGNEMTEAEMQSFLASTNHGVLSMGTAKRGYGHPLSFRYDRENDRIIMGFVNHPESKTREFVAETEEVTLTVYNYNDVDSWESVIVTGPLHRLDADEISEGVPPIFFTQAGETTDGSGWVDLDEVDRDWYELPVTNITGRHSGTLPHKDSL